MNLQVQDLVVHLGNKHIVKGVDVHLEKHEILGIIGPNGSGKSTFLKCVYRVLNPTSGTIRVNGKELDELSYRETAQQMAVVAQHNQNIFDFSVLEVALMGRSPYKKMLSQDTQADYDIVKAALEQVGMAHMEDRSFLTLSGGEQQRVMLARALAQQTECLILDEPTNHLDIKYQLETMEIVKKANVTAIIAVHDLNLAAQFCTRLIAFKEGQIVANGTPKEVLTEEFIYNLYGVQSRIMFLDDKEIPHVVFVPRDI